MFARQNAWHSQLAYVTNDIAAAARMFETTYGAPGFFVFGNVETGAGSADGPRLRIGLCNVGGVEIELIEPIGDSAPLFAAVLTDAVGLQVHFHHIAIRIDGTMADWQDYAASIDRTVHHVVFEGRLNDDLHFFYTDERARLGHYIEHVWMSPALLGQMRAAVPYFPSTPGTI